MTSTQQMVYEKLSLLGRGSGMLVLTHGDFYVQFAKHSKENNDILYEAASHQYVKSIPENLRSKFIELGFRLDEGNYYKYIQAEDAERTAAEINYIFEHIYAADFDAIEIIEEIEQ